MTGEIIGFVFGTIFMAVLGVLCLIRHSRDPFKTKTEVIFGCVYLVGSLICTAFAVGYGFFPESTEAFMASLAKNALLWLVVYIVVGALSAALAIIMFIRAYKERKGEICERKSGMIGCLGVFLCAMCVINGVQAFVCLKDGKPIETDTSYIIIAEKE